LVGIMTNYDYFKRLGVSLDFLAWVSQNSGLTLLELWVYCHRCDWMLSWLTKIDWKFPREVFRDLCNALTGSSVCANTNDWAALCGACTHICFEEITGITDSDEACAKYLEIRAMQADIIREYIPIL
jgi:hypothetical protein